MEADYALHFINRVVHDFQKDKECGDEFHQICLKLQKLSYPLKDPIVNSMKLNQNIFWRNFTNSQKIVSELQ